jgi:membrane protein YqaA with SNARE-associated domain
MKSDRRTQVLRVLALLFVVTLTVLIFLNRKRMGELEAFGYPGIFLLSAFANASLILPVPGVLITSAMGAVFNPLWVALAAGSGATVGEISGYLAGFSGRGVVERTRWHDQVEHWMRHYGALVVFLLAFFPNPLFDIAGITAGALKMPLWRFLLFCLLGKILKMLVFAYFGETVIGWFE